MSKNGIFIIGTDTDVGKTYISALIMKKLLKNNINATYFKGALSGAIKDGSELIPGDAKYVCDVSGLKEDYNKLVSYIFENAVSPHLAAVLEDDEICIEKIKNDFEYLKAKYDFVLAEGSGGIVCPIRISEDKIILLEDVVKLLGFDVIIVTRAGVGTINHTVLTVEYLKSKNIGIRGIIVNEYDEKNIAHIDNVNVIRRFTNIDILALVPKSYSENDLDDINLDLDKILSI